MLPPDKARELVVRLCLEMVKRDTWVCTVGCHLADVGPNLPPVYTSFELVRGDGPVSLFAVCRGRRLGQIQAQVAAVLCPLFDAGRVRLTGYLEEEDETSSRSAIRVNVFAPFTLDSDNRNICRAIREALNPAPKAKPLAFSRPTRKLKIE